MRVNLAGVGLHENVIAGGTERLGQQGIRLGLDWHKLAAFRAIVLVIGLEGGQVAEEPPTLRADQRCVLLLPAFNLFAPAERLARLAADLSKRVLKSRQPSVLDALRQQRTLVGRLGLAVAAHPAIDALVRISQAC